MENSFYMSSGNICASRRNHNSSEIQELSKLDIRSIGLLFLENALSRRQVRRLTQELFIARLKEITAHDTIECSEIGPLTRNSQPNESLISLKNLTSEGLTKSVNNFRDSSKVLSNEQMLAMYKQKVNELQRLTLSIQGQRRQIQFRQAQLISKIKGLRFQSVPTVDGSCQSEINLQNLGKKQIELRTLQHLLKEENSQKVMALECKENYLTYLEEAVCQKEEQLRVRQSDLARLEEKIGQQDKRYRIEPLSHLADSKTLYEYFALMKDRIYDAVQQYEQGSDEALHLMENHPLYELLAQYDKFNEGKPTALKLQILRTLEANSLEIRHKLEVAENYFKQEYDQVLQLREMLEHKNMKFAELSSYEKYLNKYKELLDVKQNQLVEARQKFNDEIQYTTNLQEKTYSIPFSDASFSAKNNDISKNSRQKIFQKRDNFNFKDYNTKHTGVELDEEKKYMSVKINEMKEQYKKRVDVLHKYDQPFLEKVQMLSTENEILKKTIANLKKQKQTTNSQCTQIDSQQNISNVLAVAKKKQLLIKYLGAWFEFDFRKNIKTPPIAKKFAFNIWRLQQYDPSIFTKIVQLTNENYEPYIERIWDSKCELERKDKLFPYKSLSLKRKQFLEEFFDFQRKQFFKNRLRTMIRSIVRNKTRKEKLVLVVSFQRFIRNCALSGPKETVQSRNPILKALSQANAQSTCTVAGLGRENNKKSISNSRTTLHYQSNKTSQVRDKSAIKLKQQLQEKDQQYRQIIENQRIELQSRLRKILACSKILSFHASKQNKVATQKACSFYYWNKSAMEKRTSQSLRKAEGKIQQFEFKMNLVNTKFKIAQSNLSSKLELIEELLSVIVPKQ